MEEKRGIPTWVAIGFALLSVALVIALVVRENKATEQKQADENKIAYHSNQWVKASSKVQDLEQVNLELGNQLTASKVEITNLTTTLVQTETNLLVAHVELTNTQNEVSKRDARIAALESQVQTLEKHADSLNDSISDLNTRIDSINSKLAAAEGDKAALSKELKRLIGEKTELERKFNDLNTLKEQVRKIRTEMVIAKRLEWARAGIPITEPKGAEKSTMTGAAKTKKNYFLNVEVNSDGTTKIIPPSTNEPAETPAGKPSK